MIIFYNIYDVFLNFANNYLLEYYRKYLFSDFAIYIDKVYLVIYYM